MAREKHIRFDWAIKRLLRQKANFDILEGFLSELLRFDVKIKEILESEGNQKNLDDKYNRVDLLAMNDKDELILIEVQNEREYDFIHRMNYGQAKLITEYIHSGESYDKIKKVYSINIVYFGLGQGKDYVYVGTTNFKGLHHNDILQLNEKQKELYSVKEVSDIFATYYLLKVNDFDDVAKDTLDEWIYFLKNSEIREEFKAKGLQEANEKLRIDNLEGEEKIAYELYLKYQRIRQNELDTAIFDKTEGLLQEIEQAKLKAEQERKEKEEAKQKEQEAKQEAEQERKEKEEAKQKEQEAKQEAEQERKEKQEAKQKEQEAKQEAEQERKEKQEAKIKFAKKMLKYGESMEEISEETGLSKAEIEKIKADFDL